MSEPAPAPAPARKAVQAADHVVLGESAATQWGSSDGTKTITNSHKTSKAVGGTGSGGGADHCSGIFNWGGEETAVVEQARPSTANQRNASSVFGYQEPAPAAVKRAVQEPADTILHCAHPQPAKSRKLAEGESVNKRTNACDHVGAIFGGSAQPAARGSQKHHYSGLHQQSSSGVIAHATAASDLRPDHTERRQAAGNSATADNMTGMLTTEVTEVAEVAEVAEVTAVEEPEAEEGAEEEAGPAPAPAAVAVAASAHAAASSVLPVEAAAAAVHSKKHFEGGQASSSVLQVSAADKENAGNAQPAASTGVIAVARTRAFGSHILSGHDRPATPVKHRSIRSQPQQTSMENALSWG